MLGCIESDDLSLRPAGLPGGPVFVRLQRRIDRVLSSFRELRLAREENLHSLLAVVRHIGIGVISFHEDGAVELINPAANTLLGIEFLWGGPVKLETSEVIATQGAVSQQEEPGPADIRWERVVYTMKDRKLAREVIDG